MTVKVEVGTVPRVENDRREDQQSTTPPSEPSHYEAPRREWESSSAADAPHDAPREERGERGDEGPRDDQQSYESASPQESGGQPPHPGQGGLMGPGGPGRGRRRGGRGRMSSRDRRMRGGRGRDRDRGPAPAYNRPPPGDRPASGGGARPHDEREEGRYSDIPPEDRSLIQQAKAEVERIRETLDGVLRDLEDVCEQLTKAEHEKDIAEAEIEQLRESLRRLQR